MSKFGFEEKTKKVVKAFEHFEIQVKIVAATISKNILTLELTAFKRQRVLDILHLTPEIRYFVGEDNLRITLTGYDENHFGVELPIDDVGDYPLREMYQATAFNNPNMKLPIYIGTDTHNRMLFDDLYSSTNMLIAGNSGTGKSAFLHSLIANIIMAKTPDEAKILIFDPKGCEWDGIETVPNVESPAIVKIKDGELKLKQLVVELKRRLELFTTSGRNNIVDYNDNEPDKIPHIVVIFDEISDYFLLGNEEFEHLLVRLLMSGRSAGIHVVISTAHTTDRVITPLIRAHCLTRIAFNVDSAEDSELIVDEAGAEHLCKVGDALYKSLYQPSISRIQAANMHEIQLRTVVPKKHIGKATNSEVDRLCEVALERLANENSDSRLIKQEDFRKMLKYCLEIGSVSTRELQIKFDLGYGKAARYTDVIKMVLEMKSKKSLFD